MKIKCNGQDILSNNFTDKDKRKLDSVQPCANNYKHPIVDGYKHLPKGGKEGQVVTHDGTSATWKNFMDFIPNKDDLFAYGVQFDTTIGDPHLTRIGNLSLHKSLPIQSQLKGCIAKGGEVQYWLNESDWRFKKDPEIITSNIGLMKDEYTITISGGSINKFKSQWVKINGVPAQIVALSINNIYIVKANTDLDNLGLTNGQSVQVELGAILNGYDGTVRVYCPEFYIKSIVDGTICKVLISETKLDNTYTYQPAVLIDAYRCTQLNTVPSNMGYLSTLSFGSLVSIVNNSTYCRGGGENTSAYDQYLTSDQFRTNLGKPLTRRTRSYIRRYCKNNNSYIMSYTQYKNIFYWLYVIEYANFNSQEDYNATLTENGYKQGGLGIGITNMQHSVEYNNACAITPCGYGNILGNKTGIVPLTIPAFTYKPNYSDINYTQSEQTMQMPRWRGFDNPFGDIGTILDGIIIEYKEDKNYIYICQNEAKFSDGINTYYTKVGELTHQKGYIKSFNLGNTANIFPDSVGASSTTYICDYVIVNPIGNINIPVVGGYSISNYMSGLGFFQLQFSVDSFSNSVGYRTVSNFIPKDK